MLILYRIWDLFGRYSASTRWEWDMPLDAVATIVREQMLWEKSRQKKSTKDSIYKRYQIYSPSHSQLMHASINA